MLLLTRQAANIFNFPGDEMNPKRVYGSYRFIYINRNYSSIGHMTPISRCPKP